MKRTKTILSIGALFFSIIACHSSKAPQVASVGSQSAGIINGQPVETNELPYRMTARILVHTRSGFWYPGCTASILADDLILTAAHCVKGSEIKDLRIGFDIQPLTYGGQSDQSTRVDVVGKNRTIEVAGFVVHPLYEKSEYDQDMALVRITEKIPEGFINTQLMSYEQMSHIDQNETYQVLLAGFGLLNEDTQTESAILRKTIVPARFEGMHVVTDQTKGSGGCNGDSGGPAYLIIDGQFYLVGVTHGPTVENQDCHHNGVWGNPNFERAFLNQSAQALGSTARF